MKVQQEIARNSMTTDTIAHICDAQKWKQYYIKGVMNWK